MAAKGSNSRLSGKLEVSSASGTGRKHSHRAESGSAWRAAGCRWATNQDTVPQACQASHAPQSLLKQRAPMHQISTAMTALHSACSDGRVQADEMEVISSNLDMCMLCRKMAITHSAPPLTESTGY